MTRKLFGTDGIRGTANIYPMTADLALKLAQATALVLNRGDHVHKVVIGKDTRLSGYMLEPALVAGFVSMGLDVILVGPMPTPAVAMLTKSLRADLGVMISASHNPFEDNGIKLFGADGFKLSDELESRIEHMIDQDLTAHYISSGGLGKAARLDDAPGRYIEFVKSTFPKGQRLEGIKVVVDCAHGAAYKIAPRILYELGAEVIAIGVDPDGKNINKYCGATDPQVMAETVVQHQAGLGIALDGDADRVILCDELGQIVDGDQLMGLIAGNWQDNGRLENNRVAATVMSNLGLERYLNNRKIDLTRTKVGDRYVVEAMRRDDIRLGGEQSGHVILSDYGTTGDGLVAALQALSALEQSDKPASELCQVFTPVPQILENIRVRDRQTMEDGAVKDLILEKTAALEGRGRILVRASGTEPLIRVMAEGDDKDEISRTVKEIIGKISEADALKATG